MPRGFALVVFALGLAAPAFPQSLKDRAQTFYEQGKFLEAARTLERHLGENPEDFQARLLLGLCHQQAGDPLASAAAYQQAADQRPDDSIARFRLAQAQYFAGKFAYAEKNARASLRLGGAPAYIHNLIGLVLEQKHNYEQAVAAYDAAIQGAARDYGEPYLNAGILLLRLGRAAEALERLHSATEINPRSREALYYRARAYLATGKVPQARKILSGPSPLGTISPPGNSSIGCGLAVWRDRSSRKKHSSHLLLSVFATSRKLPGWILFWKTTPHPKSTSSKP